MNILKTTFEVGVQSVNSAYLNTKIRIGNQIAVFLFFLGIIYGTITLFYLPWLSIFPFGASLVAIVSILLNYFSFNYSSRFLMAIGSIILDSIYHAYNVKQGDSMIFSLYFSQFSFSLYPWVLSDIREKKLLIPTVAINLLILVSQPWLNDVFEINEPIFLFRSTGMTYVTMFFASLILIICLLSLQVKNYQNETLLTASKTRVEEAFDELKSVQEHMIQQEKMTSLGIFTAGMAHEINNPLNFIAGGVEYLKDYIQENCNENHDKTIGVVKGIDEGVRRVTKIVKTLGSYTKDPNVQNQECNIHTIIDNCLTILNKEYISRIRITKNYTLEKFKFFCNEGKLHQVFLNVLLNASQSIDNGGVVDVTTSVNNGHLLVIVTDNGCGIHADFKHKIFDPFFTTKEPGKGIGLGLSIVYRIIQEHNGLITIDSEINTGTRVSIKLPLKNEA